MNVSISPRRLCVAAALMLGLMAAAASVSEGRLGLTVQAQRAAGGIDVHGSVGLGALREAGAKSVVFVLDLSPSAARSAGTTCPGGRGGRTGALVVDCEIAAVRGLISSGKIREAALVGFAGSAVAASPDGTDAPFLRPGPDIGRMLDSIRVDGRDSDQGGFFGERRQALARSVGTNFARAIRRSARVARQASARDVTVVFLSDGAANEGEPIESALAGADGLTFQTFAVGRGASCDEDGPDIGSLGDLARLTGGSCTAVREAGDLRQALERSSALTLARLSVGGDGSASRTLRGSALSRSLPARAPVTVDYRARVTGAHRRVCVAADAVGLSGTRRRTECAVVTPSGGVAAGIGPSPVRSAGAARVLIPSIGVAAPVRRTGLAPDGTLAVPDDAVGSYVSGPRVLVGHVGWNGAPGWFADLAALDAGDRVRLLDRRRRTREYVVTRREQHPKADFPTRRVYFGPRSALRLITCGGPFDSQTRSYRDNIVVYAKEVAS